MDRAPLSRRPRPHTRSIIRASRAGEASLHRECLGCRFRSRFLGTAHRGIALRVWRTRIHSIMHDAIERCHDAVAARSLFSLWSWQHNNTILALLAPFKGAPGGLRTASRANRRRVGMLLFWANDCYARSTSKTPEKRSCDRDRQQPSASLSGWSLRTRAPNHSLRSEATIFVCVFGKPLGH
jgi:hypothetical protein